MDFFKQHPVLLKIPEGREAVRRYNRLARTLVMYELTYYDHWRRQSVSVCLSFYTTYKPQLNEVHKSCSAR